MIVALRRTAAVLRRRAVRLLAVAGLAAGVAACDAPVIGPSIDASRPVSVGLLLPYGSGNPNTEALARSLENAARLALADLGGSSLDLQVFPDGGTPEGAAAAARQAADSGARILIGPVFAEAANAAGAAVAGRGINVLSFSNNPDVAGRNVYILGTSFDTVAERLVGFAAQRGRDRLMVIHANNVAGEIGRRAVERATPGSGAGIVATGTYQFSQQGVVEALPTIAARARESGANALIFTSDTSGALPLLAQLLPDNRVNPAEVKFVGLTRWDLPPQTLGLRGLQGGWFAIPDPAIYGGFEARYRAAHGAPPHPIAGLAYDAVAAVGALVQTGASDALSGPSLTRASGFAGVNGVFRLRDDGTVQRALAVAEIDNNEVKVIDPAPRSFVAAGF